MIEALISGTAARAAFIDGARCWYIEADRPDQEITISRNQIYILFRGAADVERVKVKAARDSYQILLRKYNEDRAIRLFDIALSKNYSDKLRSAAIQEFMSLRQEGSGFSEGIDKYIFSNPSVEISDVYSCIDDFSYEKKFITYLSRLAEAYPHIVGLNKSLDLAIYSNGLSGEDASLFKSKAIHSGVFFKLVKAKGDGEKLNPVIMDAYLRLSELPQARVVIQDWTKSFLDKRSKRTLKDLAQEYEKFSSEDYLPSSRDDRNRLHLFKNALRQQEAIIEKVVAGDLNNARKFAGQLATEQLYTSGAEYAAKSLSNLATQARDLGHANLELEWAKMAIEYKPDDGFAMGILADTYLKLYRLAEAQVHFEKAIELGEVNFGKLGIARTYKAGGQPEKAIEHTQLLLEKLPIYDKEAPFAYWVQASALKDMWKLEQAMDVCNKAVNLFPEASELICMRAATRALMGQLDEALEDYDAAIEINSFDEVPYTGKASVLARKGEFQAAVDLFNDTAKKFPHSPYPTIGIASTLSQAGRAIEAIDILHRAIERFSHIPDAYCALAEAHRNNGEMREAYNAYKYAISKFELDTVARNGYANILKVMGRFEEALREYEKNVKDFPYDLVSLCGRADLLKRLGSYEAALSAYDAIMERHPDYGRAKSSKAAIYVALSRFDLAEACINPNAPRTQDEWVNLHVKAMMLLGKKEYDEAIKILLYGYEQTPFHRERQYFRTSLAAARMQKKDFVKAEELLIRQHSYLDNILYFHCLGALGKSPEAIAFATVANDNLSKDEQILWNEIEKRYLPSNAISSLSDEELFLKEFEILLRAA